MRGVRSGPEGEQGPQFGRPAAGVVYGERPSAYGLAADGAGRILACRRSGGRVVLPGGGLAPGESPLEALAREVAEETGYRVRSACELCRARQYHTRRIGKPPANKLCRFYAVEVEHDPTLAREADHEPVWLSPAALLPALTFESHRWALRRLQARRPPRTAPAKLYGLRGMSHGASLLITVMSSDGLAAVADGLAFDAADLRRERYPGTLVRYHEVAAGGIDRFVARHGIEVLDFAAWTATKRRLGAAIYR